MKRPKVRLGFYLFLLIPAIACFALAIIATIDVFQEGATKDLMAEGFFLMAGCSFIVFAVGLKRKEEELFPEKRLS